MTIIDYSFEFEERLAAMANHYTWEQYQNLPGIPDWAEEGENDKSTVIATFRAKSDLEAARW